MIGFVPTGTFVFVVDTDEYAGNFEREMCAFSTAQVGECGVGEDIAAEVAGAIPPTVLEWFARHVQHVADDHGCARPCSIWPTPGWYNDGVGHHAKGDPSVAGRHPAYQSVAMFFDESPPAEAAECLRARCRSYAGSGSEYVEPFAITGFRLLRQPASALDELASWGASD